MFAKTRRNINKSCELQTGFNIIELLVIIVVIGILASIITVNYGGAQAKSRDSERTSEAKAIEAALESYRSKNTGYPPSSTATQVAGASTGGWETSGAAQPGTFISALKPLGFPTGTPSDPTNNTLADSGNTYRYKTFTAGSNGCDATKGDYYVFIVNNLETVSGASPQSSGFSCSGHNWQTDGDYAFGRFVNE